MKIYQNKKLVANLRKIDSCVEENYLVEKWILKDKKGEVIDIFTSHCPLKEFENMNDSDKLKAVLGIELYKEQLSLSYGNLVAIVENPRELNPR